MNIDEIKGRFEKSRTRRHLWESMWEDCINYCMPARQSFWSSRPGQERTELVFDETPITATAEFASRMQSAIMPPGRKWFAFKAVGDTGSLDETKRLQGQLDEVAEYLYLQMMRSNMDAEMHEAFMDLAIGTCGLSIDLDRLNKLVFKTAALPTLWIDEGPDGLVGGVFRRRQDIAAYKLVGLYPQAEIDPKGEKVYNIIEATVKDYSRIDAEVWYYRVWLEETGQILEENDFEGWGSSPWVCARWAETAEEWYGRGPLINLLPAIRGVNLSREIIFEAGEMTIGGVYQYDNDGTINPEQIEIAPGTFIPRAPGSRGLEPLPNAANFDFSRFNLEEGRAAIRRGLFSEEFTPQGRTPLSAQEIAARQNDLAQRVGSPFSRVLKELAQPIVIRAARLYQDAGMIEMPEIDGKNIQVVSVSPLARAQNAETITRYLNFIGALVQMMGPEAAGSYIKTEENVAMMASLYEFPMHLLHNNDSRVEEAQRGQELQSKLQESLRVLPTQEFQQRIERGPIQGNA